MKKPELRRGQASVYALAQQQRLKQRAFRLYKEGKGTREVAGIVGKSHVWVARAVRELQPKKPA